MAEEKEMAEVGRAAEEELEATAAENPESIEPGSAEEPSAAVEVPAAEATSEPEEEVPAPVDLDALARRGDVYYYGTGRRKTSSAQVRLYPSKEPAIVVNDKPVDEYFSRREDILLLQRPLRTTGTEEMFRITVKVEGGGITGQAGAVRHGIARALTRANPEWRRSLRREGSLTRDPRMKERKKPGLKRARKAPQYTKR